MFSLQQSEFLIFKNSFKILSNIYFLKKVIFYVHILKMFSKNYSNFNDNDMF